MGQGGFEAAADLLRTEAGQLGRAGAECMLPASGGEAQLWPTYQIQAR